MKLSRLALLLFLLTPLAFAIDFTALVPITAVCVIIFIALANALAHAIANPGLEAWAKTELRELVFGIILVIIIVTFFIGSNAVAEALTGTPDYIDVAVKSLDAMILRCDEAFKIMIRMAGKIRTAATFSPYTGIPIYFLSITYSTNPLGGMGILLGPLTSATQPVSNALFLMEGLRMLLRFFSVVIPKVLLPLSLAIRLIPFTRRLGNTLIAVSLGAMVIFPFSAILADQLNQGVMPAQPDVDLSKLDANPWAMVVLEPTCESEPIRFISGLTDPAFAAIVCLPAIGPYYEACHLYVWFVVYPAILFYFQLGNTAAITGWESAYATGIIGKSYATGAYDMVRMFLTYVNNFVLVIYLDTVLITLITIAGIRSISAALGGEWYMPGIQRFI